MMVVTPLREPPMKSVVLAAPEPSRQVPESLREDRVTEPVLVAILRWLRAGGEREVLVSEHHAAIDEAREGEPGLDVEVFSHDAGRGDASVLAGLREGLGDRPALVVDPSGLFGFDVPALRRAHEHGPAIATLALWPVAASGEPGNVELDRAGRILRLLAGRTGRSLRWWNTGVAVMEPRLLDAVPAGADWTLEKDLYSLVLREQGILMGYPVRSRAPEGEPVGCPQG